jgi:hypothetical protein
MSTTGFLTLIFWNPLASTLLNKNTTLHRDLFTGQKRGLGFSSLLFLDLLLLMGAQPLHLFFLQFLNWRKGWASYLFIDSSST